MGAPTQDFAWKVPDLGPTPWSELVPSAGVAPPTGTTPDPIAARNHPASTMSWSDCLAAILPPPPLRLVGSFCGSGQALPSSDASNSMTCRGLRPRRGEDILTDSGCRTAGFRENHPLAHRERMRFRGSIPSLALRPIICYRSGSAQFVTSLCSEFCSGLVVSLWPGWMVQLVRTSFTWRTICALREHHLGKSFSSSASLSRETVSACRSPKRTRYSLSESFHRSRTLSASSAVTVLP